VSRREIGRSRIGKIVAVHEHRHREQTVLPGSRGPPQDEREGS
jgi:hypothetical protein